MVLQELADLGIHSIEQPIKKSEVRSPKSEENSEKNQRIAVFHWNEMAKLCTETPTPIALG